MKTSFEAEVSKKFFQKVYLADTRNVFFLLKSSEVALAFLYMYSC